MKKILTTIFSLGLLAGHLHAGSENFTCEPDLAQYGASDYSNVVHVARGISLEQAFDIAESHPDIGYFVYVKGGRMVLEIPSDQNYDAKYDPFALVTFNHYVRDNGQLGKGYCRVFNQGDALFFKNEGKWLSSAPDLADTYVKN